MKNKKAVIDDLANLLTTLGGIAILMAVIFLIMAEAKTQVIEIDPCGNSTQFYNSTTGLCQMPGLDGVTSYSAAYNATSDVQNATSDIPGWLPIVIITVIGGILLTLVRFFKSGK